MDGCGMERFKAGMLARSKAGHDIGKVYVIIEVDDAYVYLADGSIRTLKNLKKKKKKHVQVICSEAVLAGADDIAIRKIVKMEEY